MFLVLLYWHWVIKGGINICHEMIVVYEQDTQFSAIHIIMIEE